MGTESLLGLPPVEENGGDGCVLVEETKQVVGLLCVADDSSVQTSFSIARRKHIPQSDARVTQRLEAHYVLRMMLAVTKIAHDAPEVVAWVCVVLRGCQRRTPGHGSENQYSWRVSNDRVERVYEHAVSYRRRIGSGNAANPPGNGLISRRAEVRMESHTTV